MRTKSEPIVIGLLAAFYYLALVLACVWLAGCAAPTMQVQDEPVVPIHSPAQRADAAVEVYTECGTGSGVLVSNARVYTAMHVVNCLQWPLVYVAKSVMLRTRDNQFRIGKVTLSDGGRDIAKIEPNQPFNLELVPARVRKAVKEEIVCAATAKPERGFKCGIVSDVALEPRQFGDMKARGMSVWFGNSGSGVYAEDGALVGVVTRLEWCDETDAQLYENHEIIPERTCAGRFSSLIDSPVMQ